MRTPLQTFNRCRSLLALANNAARLDSVALASVDIGLSPWLEVVVGGGFTFWSLCIANLPGAFTPAVERIQLCGSAARVRLRLCVSVCCVCCVRLALRLTTLQPSCQRFCGSKPV